MNKKKAGPLTARLKASEKTKLTSPPSVTPVTAPPKTVTPQTPTPSRPTTVIGPPPDPTPAKKKTFLLPMIIVVFALIAILVVALIYRNDKAKTSSPTPTIATSVSLETLDQVTVVLEKKIDALSADMASALTDSIKAVRKDAASMASWSYHAAVDKSTKADVELKKLGEKALFTAEKAAVDAESALNLAAMASVKADIAAANQAETDSVLVEFLGNIKGAKEPSIFGKKGKVAKAASLALDRLDPPLDDPMIIESADTDTVSTKIDSIPLLIKVVVPDSIE